MLELPEVLTVTKQLQISVVGKTVKRVLPPTKPHKFCWYNGDPTSYNKQLANTTVQSAVPIGIFAEIAFDNRKKLCFNDGVNARLVSELPKNYQLAILFDDGDALAFTVAMYGGIVLHDGCYDNDYYLKSKSAISPFSEEFTTYYNRIFAESKQTLSAKAFLATEQRFPGIGNGVLQDILFAARLHPKRKIATLTATEKDILLSAIRTVLQQMIDGGGRDTERDLFGNVGGYRTNMSKNVAVCPICGSTIIKEAYLGGSVYYCPVCQPLE